LIFVSRIVVLQARFAAILANHLGLHHVVMPFFLFMVGMSMSFSLRRYKVGLLRKVLTRTAKLFLLGLATQGGAHFPTVRFQGWDLKYLHIPGILQRIAWTYLVVSLIAMYIPKIDASRYILAHIVVSLKSIAQSFEGVRLVSVSCGSIISLTLIIV
jgi:predicted acyltransferase